MNNKKLTIATLILSVSFMISSCRSTDSVADNTNNSGNSTFNSGEAVLKFGVLDNDFESADSENPTPTASINGVRGTNKTKEQTKVYLVEDKALVATLSPVVNSLSAKAQAGINPMAATYPQPIKGPLKYRVIVYNSNGTRVGTKTYTIDAAGASTPDAGGDMYLDNTAGNYTFVAYSYGTNVAPPDATGDLSIASLSAIDGNSDLMYFRRDNMPLIKGDNNLNILLTHMFSQVTTKLDATAVASGAGIKSITPATISRHRIANNSIKLSDGTITYSAADIGSKTVDFSANSTSSPVWTSQPTLVVNPGTGGVDAPSLTLTNMTVGTKVKTQTIDGLMMKPGVKYNLNLTFKCTEVGTPTYTFNLSDSGTGTRLNRTYTDFPATDAGFTFDIYELDNSFNLTINGTSVYSQEIQFQSGVAGYRRNIRFKSDKTLWGGSTGNAEIYNMHGYNATTPANSATIFRIIIAPDGTVTMMGRRNYNSPGTSALEPVELYQAASTDAGDTNAYAKTAATVPFNKVTWNSSALNTVNATLLVTGVTKLQGFGYGIKTKPCP
ncbi:hypothetical protein [Elizabethkingia meningoseptica]|uniref:hypothetical protein n=1 Tax=Elizabethkingia meningoseptica TaxID=238 RepID=UPI0038914158